jgi:hypothetical protein
VLTALDEYLTQEYNRAMARCEAFKKDLPYRKKNFGRHQE